MGGNVLTLDIPAYERNVYMILYLKDVCILWHMIETVV